MEVFKFQHPSCFITGERDAWYGTGEWVGPTVGLNAWEKLKCLFSLPAIKPRLLGSLVRGQLNIPQDKYRTL